MDRGLPSIAPFIYMYVYLLVVAGLCQIESRIMATSIRVENALHRILLEIVESEHRSIGKVVEEAVRLYEKEKFWNEVDRALERLHADPVASREYLDELAEWNAMPNEVLAAEPRYFMPQSL